MAYFFHDFRVLAGKEFGVPAGGGSEMELPMTIAAAEAGRDPSR
ncbi:hypothetical protein [uncultured Propionivibrio sp.]|nr:hypothetical protein [uncultured Propionivibrio sp.]